MMTKLLPILVGAFALVEVRSDSDGYHFSRIGTIPVPVPDSVENESSFWNDKAQKVLAEQLRKKPNTNKAKNIIMFMGDGMSIPTLAATRIYKWQRENKKMGEDEFLSFEEFPYLGLSRTYCVDAQVADSACSATAYLGGVKGNIGTIGVNAYVKRQDCAGSLNTTNHVDSIALWAQEAGMSTGIVTTTRVTHASPAGTFAHIADRNWESDSDILADGNDPVKCIDIAKQLIQNSPGKNFNVILGGGRQKFLPVNLRDNTRNEGVRKDGIDLIEAWVTDKMNRNVSYALVSDRIELNSLQKMPEYLLGLFANSHLEYNLEANSNQPTLEEMTSAAIRVLQKNEKGFFLFVEGGKIDMAHHENWAQKSFDETIEFAKAIARAKSMTDESETLIIATADHAHTMSVSGYPRRTESIFGFGGKGTDEKPYSIISYANGRGFRIVHGQRPDISKDDREDLSYSFPATAPLLSETHGGDDVAVFADGPFAHIFTGSYEQNYIPHAMAYASCIGNGLKACDEN